MPPNSGSSGFFNFINSYESNANWNPNIIEESWVSEVSFPWSSNIFSGFTCGERKLFSSEHSSGETPFDTKRESDGILNDSSFMEYLYLFLN